MLICCSMGETPRTTNWIFQTKALKDIGQAIGLVLVILERTSFKIKGANLGRLKPIRHFVGEEDVRGQAHNNQHHGRHGRKEGHSSICPDPNFQFGSKPTGMQDGGDGTCSGAQAGRGVQEDSSEGNGMDHDGPNEDSSSNWRVSWPKPPVIYEYHTMEL